MSGGDTSTSDREICISVRADNAIMDGNVLQMKTKCMEDLVFVAGIFRFVEELFSVYYLMYLSSNWVRRRFLDYSETIPRSLIG